MEHFLPFEHFPIGITSTTKLSKLYISLSLYLPPTTLSQNWSQMALERNNQHYLDGSVELFQFFFFNQKDWLLFLSFSGPQSAGRLSLKKQVQAKNEVQFCTFSLLHQMFAAKSQQQERHIIFSLWWRAQTPYSDVVADFGTALWSFFSLPLFPPSGNFLKKQYIRVFVCELWDHTVLSGGLHCEKCHNRLDIGLGSGF